jgi:hypothetical protein
MKLLETPRYRKHLAGETEDAFMVIGTQMALVHNMFMRAFNTIYLVAPRVPQTEFQNFVEYSFQVYKAVRNHHREEEEYVFPAIEEATGEKGIMEVNEEQHRELRGK